MRYQYTIVISLLAVFVKISGLMWNPWDSYSQSFEAIVSGLLHGLMTCLLVSVILSQRQQQEGKMLAIEYLLSFAIGSVIIAAVLSLCDMFWWLWMDGGQARSIGCLSFLHGYLGTLLVGVFFKESDTKLTIEVLMAKVLKAV